jgi:PNKP adenylyltransferase domain, ligase domain
MGSRAILIVCRSKDVARERFGILEDEEGVCYTRTGRRFFEDLVLERELLGKAHTSVLLHRGERISVDRHEPFCPVILSETTCAAFEAVRVISEAGLFAEPILSVDGVPLVRIHSDQFLIVGPVLERTNVPQQKNTPQTRFATGPEFCFAPRAIMDSVECSPAVVHAKVEVAGLS